MSIGAQAFQVLTEFRFEAGSALATTSSLTGAVDGLNESLNQTQYAFQGVGLSLLSSLGLGGAGGLGILYKAIQATDKFTNSQIAIANTIAGATVPFNTRMEMAAETLQRINKLASEFALPTSDLIDITKTLGPLLQAKGLAGHQFSTAIDIGRNLLKSAPTLGIDPQLVQGQLIRLIEGQASTGDTLFNRLSGDTKAFKPFLGNSKAFNSLPEVERVNKLKEALKQFAADPLVLAANVRTLRGQMILLNDTVSGAFSTFRKVGDILFKPIIDALVFVNAWMRNEGMQISKSFARLLEPLVNNPERLLATIFQFRQLKKDLDMAEKVLFLTGALIGLHHILGMLGITVPLLSAGLARFAAFIHIFEGSLFTIGAATTIFGRLFVFASAVIAPLLLLVGIFQLISRAIGIAHIQDAKVLFSLSPLFAELAARFTRIFDVFMEGFDNLARLISPLFEVSRYIEAFASLLEFLSIAATLALGSIQGIFFAILEFANQITSLLSGGGFNFSSIGDSFTAGVDSMIERILGGVGDGESTVQQTTVNNINKVEIRNDFKEQMEPDRIAFTLKEQLLKAANNPGQAAGRSLSGLRSGS